MCTSTVYKDAHIFFGFVTMKCFFSSFFPFLSYFSSGNNSMLFTQSWMYPYLVPFLVVRKDVLYTQIPDNEQDR